MLCALNSPRSKRARPDRLPLPPKVIELANLCKTDIGQLAILLEGQVDDDSICDTWLELENPIQGAFEILEQIPGSLLFFYHYLF
jgi:hypothetical protein